MNFFKKAAVFILCLTLNLVSVGVIHVRAQNQTAYPNQSRLGNVFVASNYSYSRFPMRVSTGNAATGTGTLTFNAGFTQTNDNHLFSPFTINTPLLVDIGTPQETVTPTAAACGQSVGGNGVPSSCTITGTFNNLHGSGTIIVSGTFGLQEAINDAFQSGGGQVVVDNAWTQLGGTNAMITAAQVFPTVVIKDLRNGIERNWNPTPTGAALAVPTTLTAQAACDATHQACSDATVAGSASWGGTVFAAVAYVDIMGNEGPPSLTASWTSVASKAIDIQAPAASPGAVGYVVYLSLSGGTYAQAYQIPSTALNCTLTTLETITPACAVANTAYGQAASTFGALSTGLFTTGGSQITTFPLNTGQHFTQLGSTAMTAASLTPISNSSVTYSYAPSSRVGACGSSSANVIKYAASGSSATTIPNAIATWTIQANCFNFIGSEFRVSGKWTYTDGGDTSTEVRVGWDAALSNATTVPTTLCSMLDTATGTAAAYNGTYTCTIKTATTGATGTALVNGYASQNLAAGATTLVRNGADIAVAPSAATVNWTVPARVVVYFIGTGATNNPGAQGLEATLEVVN